MRSFDPQMMVVAMAEGHRPAFRFEGETREQFERWQSAARPKVLACLGESPPSVSPNGEQQFTVRHDIHQWEAFGMRDINYCGMQVAPDLYTLVDLHPHELGWGGNKSVALFLRYLGSVR